MSSEPEDSEPVPVAININVVDARVRNDDDGISPTLNIPQARFLAMPHKFRAYVAGFGSGKTWVGCGGICKEMWEHPRINQGYFAPTYPQIRDIFIRRLRRLPLTGECALKSMKVIKRCTSTSAGSTAARRFADRWKNHRRSWVSKSVMRLLMSWMLCPRKSGISLAKNHCPHAL